MLQEKIEKICQEYYQKCSKEGLKVNLGRLRALATISAKKAKENYLKINAPKTCSEEVYISCWVREALDRNFVLKTLIKVDFKNPPPDPYYQALTDYFSLFPTEFIRPINKEINNTEPSKRLQKWESYSLATKEIEKRFAKLIAQRKKYLLKGKQPLIEIFLRKFKIPRADYERFIENKEEIINFCNQILPNVGELPDWFYSELNLPCFVCKIQNFPLRSLDEVINFVSDKYLLVKKFRAKIKVIMADNTYMIYDKKSDCFLIKINENVNFRHRAIGLIHELGHVINFLKDFQKGIDPLERGKYIEEKEAFKFELQVLGELSEDLLKAIFADVLLTFRREIFEIDLYDNPHQDIGKLYAHTFNRCFPEANQKRNPFYILDESIVTNPFSSLHHAIAYAEVIWNLMQDVPAKRDLAKLKLSS